MKLTRAQHAHAAALLPPSTAPEPLQKLRQGMAAGRLAASLAPAATVAAALALLVAGIALGAVLVLLFANGKA